jgi:hypothetical protein
MVQQVKRLGYTYASRGWHGAFIGDGERAAEVGRGSLPNLVEA